MDIFVKASAAVLIAVVLCVVVSRQNKDIALLMTLAVCCMVLALSMGYLRSVIDFFSKLEAIGGLDSEWIKVLLKAVGIGLLAEITSLICADSGNNAMAKSVQLLATGLILSLAIPMFTQLLELLESILVKQ